MKGQGCGCCLSEATRAMTMWVRSINSIPRKDGFVLDSINYYQRHIDPQIKKDMGVKKICTFTPTCSQYAKAAVKKNGPLLGMLMGALRIARCNPLTGGGYDPA